MIEPVLQADASLRDAVQVIEKTRRFIAVVVDDEGKLLGTISDGDIRRAMLAGIGLDGPAAKAMNRRPITADSGFSNDRLLHTMVAKGVAALPVVDGDGCFKRVVQPRDFDLDDGARSGGEGYAAAVIMAGGEGLRLMPLTADQPKPMMTVGGVPLLERQVRSMVQVGLRRIYIATNYLGHLIERHFGDGAAFGAEVRYLRESRKLGTAGALSLAPRGLNAPILVVNGDVLTTSDYGNLLSYHEENKAFITVSAIEHHVEIPFGVINIESARATAIEEKPSQRFLCNAGIYVLSPEAMESIPPDATVDMTELIQMGINQGRVVAVFPIHEYWADIGNHSDLERARREFVSTLSGDD